MEGSGTAGGSFLKLAKAEANLSLSGELGKEYVFSTTSREIISKVLHDAAFVSHMVILSHRNFL